jgi:flagellar biosynthesis protein FlhA
LADPKGIRNSGAIVTFAIVGIIFIMLVPLPTPILDILLSINITLSLVILLVSMYVTRSLDFSVFPSLLLVVTLFRLSLNVASTRLILLQANAGKIIAAFGSFVAGGDIIVGVVIFLVLILINFVVITKGAGRVAEVAARFTLDAMPGKQMSIDADLNAGLITDDEARRRRAEIASEADFYGAMDGASKFVRGDAVAGLVITVINIIGGLIIGITKHGMPIGDAAATYTILTIGDGLVSQLPALVISTSAGIVVTRTTTTTNMGAEILKQLLQEPAALWIVSILLFVLGAVPGLPMAPFFILAVIISTVAVFMKGTRLEEIKERAVMEQMMEKEKEKEEEPTEEELVEPLLHVDVLEVEVGYGLLNLIDPAHGGDLLDRIKSIRRQIAVDLGIIIPPVRIRDNLQLEPNQYNVLIKGVEVVRYELLAGYLLAMSSGEEPKSERMKGIPAKEPAFGLEAIWIEESERDRAQMLNYTVVDHSTIVATHLTEIIKIHASELLGRQEAQNLLNGVAARSPKLVEELTPAMLSLGIVQKVLQNLLSERVSIRDLNTILETLADYAAKIKDPTILTEYARGALARSISKQYEDIDGNVPVTTIDHALEQKLQGVVKRSEEGIFLAIEPTLANKLIDKFGAVAKKMSEMNYQPIIMTTPLLRAQLRKLVEKMIPNLVFLSHNEIVKNIKTVDVLNVEAGAGA